MRFLKTLTLNRRAIYDGRVALTTADDFTLVESRSMVLPKSNGTITSPVTGQLRYNTTSNEVEVYQGSSATWRTIRYKESTGITQQNLGYGDATTVYFGPLNPAPPTVVQSGATWGGQNLLVIVENVIQLHSVNYTIEQNPTIAGVTYTDQLSANTNIGSAILTFDPNTTPIYPSVSITGATLSGTNVPGGATVSSYTVNAITGALTTITMSTNALAQITSGTTITITDATNVGSGYYIKFRSAVPYGKPVTVLHGFDQ